MKVCLIGNYKESSGYSNASMEYALSMDCVGIDVVTRNITMTRSKRQIPNRMVELENKDLENVDIVFQYNLPSEFSYKGNVVNAGGYAYETSGFPNSDWGQHLELMDLVIVPCNYQKEILKDKTKDKTYVVPIPTDIDKFNKTYPTIDFGLPKNTLKFYTISEYNRRKNIPGLILAYLSTFTSDDDVILIIKTNIPSKSSQETDKIINETVEDFKRGMKKFKKPNRYPKIILLSSYISDEYICGLHQQCDVFVSTSHGEGFCIPAQDAIGFGNAIVVPNHGAFKDYGYETGILVDGVESPVFGVTDSPDGLYTSDEKWFNINISELSDSMKKIYKNKDRWPKDKIKEINYQYVKDNFSREKIGNQLKEIFTNAIET